MPLKQTARHLCRSGNRADPPHPHEKSFPVSPRTEWTPAAPRGRLRPAPPTPPPRPAVPAHFPNSPITASGVFISPGKATLPGSSSPSSKVGNSGMGEKPPASARPTWATAFSAAGGSAEYPPLSAAGTVAPPWPRACSDGITLSPLVAEAATTFGEFGGFAAGMAPQLYTRPRRAQN